MQAPRPNLFLIGAMKSGTTYLSELLGSHPQIFMCTPKEPCYFLDPRVLRRVWFWAWEQGYWRSLDRYLGLFAAAGDAVVVGEASTFYSQRPLFSGVPERIRAFNPDARFVYIMRDPLERTISHYWHRVRWWGEHRDVTAAIRAYAPYCDVSYYARQLQAYLRHFDRERIYVLTLEGLLADPFAELRRIYLWLGVEADFCPSNVGIADNVLPAVVDQVRSPPVLDRLRRSLPVRALAPYVPSALRQLGGRLVPIRHVRPADVDTSHVQAFLRPLQQAQTEELERLLDRRFSEWKTLYGLAECPRLGAGDLTERLT